MKFSHLFLLLALLVPFQILSSSEKKQWKSDFKGLVNDKDEKIKYLELETLLTEGRIYGGCSILALQSPAQLESIYGREVAKVFIGNTATKVIFRERDPEIADLISKAIGEREVMDIQEGISYGAHEARDGVSLSMQNKTRPVVSATQVIELPINTAYVKLAEEKAVAKVKLRIAKKT